MRAILITPSSNRFRAGQRNIYLATWGLLRLLHESPHNYDALGGRRHIQRPRNTAPSLQSHLPKTAYNMLDVRLAHSFQTIPSISPAIRASLTCMSSGKSSTSPSTVPSRVSTVQAKCYIPKTVCRALQSLAIAALKVPSEHGHDDLRRCAPFRRHNGRTRRP